MIEKSLKNIAEKVLTFDEASLTRLWEKYKSRMERFDTSREWEESVIIFFLINAVRVKNQIFNDRISQLNTKETEKPTYPSIKKDFTEVSYLKRIK